MAVKVYQTSSSSVPVHEVPPSREGVAHATVPGTVCAQTRVGFTGATIAVAQLSFAGGGGGVPMHISKTDVWPAVAVLEYTLTL